MIARAYYNEIDPYAAQWLRNLIAAGHIAPGDVDERDIQDVLPSDLAGYTQCHFFAGVGVWSYALRRAGWPDDRPVWTGSCPCQPFSTAGDGLAFADERHLWPAFFHLIEKRRPPEIFGEQVASKDADPWIDLVQDDLEGLGYAVGAVPFPSAGIGAPHIRDRLYWLANAGSTGLPQRERHGRVQRETLGASQGKASHGVCASSRMADSNGPGAQCRPRHYGEAPELQADEREPEDRPDVPQRGGADCDGRNAVQGHGLRGDIGIAGPTNGLWRNADWLRCTDGKWRPVEPGTFPLADGAAARVGRLRAYGNAINAEAATEFVRAYLGVGETA